MVDSKLRVTPTAIPDVLIIEPKVFSDNRGWFTESFNAQDFAKVTQLNIEFVQDNHSFSRQWTLRGLHYQLKHTQGKLVRVTAGSVFDVVVDLRKDSATFGQWAGEILSAENHRQLWIPPGFGHAFLVLEDRTDFLYKTTDYYAPQSEASIAWDDPQINIEWPKGFKEENITLSVKDQAAPRLNAARVFD